MLIPEIQAHSTNAREAFSDSGAIIIRGALRGDVFDQLSLLSAAVFSIMDLKVKERVAGEARSDDPFAQYVDRYSKLQFVGEDLARSLLAQAHLGNAGFDKISTRIGKIVSSAFQQQLEFVPGKSAVRRQGTTGNAQKSAYVPWHRDAHAVQTAELGECLNCWTPARLGRARKPVAPGRCRIEQDATPRRVDYSQLDNPSVEEVLDQYGSERICTAMLEPGDFMVLDHHTLHRTQPMGHSYLTRMSGEMRFVVAG